MKPDTAPRNAPESPGRVEFQVRFSLGTKGRRHERETRAVTQAEAPVARKLAPDPAPAFVPACQVPKITRLLVLGHHFERLVRAGAVADYAEIARLTGLTRARVTQIVNLTLLAPPIQEAILTTPRGSPEAVAKTERDLRATVRRPGWSSQRKTLREANPVPRVKSRKIWSHPRPSIPTFP